MEKDTYYLVTENGVLPSGGMCLSIEQALQESKEILKKTYLTADVYEHKVKDSKIVSIKKVELNIVATVVSEEMIDKIIKPL